MRALSHIRNETNELRLLFEVCQGLEATGDLSQQMETVLRRIAQHTAMLWGGITLVNTEKEGSPPPLQWLSAPISSGDGEHPVATHRAAMGDMVLKSAQPVILPATASPPIPLHRGNLRTLHKEDITLFAVPIIHGSQMMGVLFADKLFADSVALEEDVRLLQVIVSLIAQALNVRRDFECKHNAVMEENRRLQAMLHSQFMPGTMVGNSAALQAVFSELTHVADSNATVLILGESGTGKELVAAAIHANSSRADKSFVRLNCAALPEGLVESELFGHERGAFTGATGTRKGRFEMAHGGTLFLDEVGDLTALTQAKLLRVLQEKEFERVGGAQTIRVDVRLISATNRNLEQMVAEGTFRQDLYYRLSVFPIALPPLRSRREDIVPLAIHFAEKYGPKSNAPTCRVSPEATNLLIAYPWPGNIRELENIIERAILLSGGGIIEAEHLPQFMQKQDVPKMERHGSLDSALNALELHLITEALSEAKGNMAKAAGQLGLTERIMGLRMKKYALNFKDFRNK